VKDKSKTMSVLNELSTGSGRCMAQWRYSFAIHIPGISALNGIMSVTEIVYIGVRLIAHSYTLFGFTAVYIFYIM
jgi:hypothetical protein